MDEPSEGRQNSFHGTGEGGESRIKALTRLKASLKHVRACSAGPFNSFRCIFIKHLTQRVTTTHDFITFLIKRGCSLTFHLEPGSRKWA